MMKKLLIVLVVTLLSASVVYASEPVEQQQTDSVEMEIHSAQDLLLFAEEVNGGNKTLNAVLEADIDLSDLCSESAGSWVPIEEYEGEFNGNGHTITGLYCVNPESSAGLFLSAYSGSHILDLNLEDVYVEGKKYAAGVVARGSGTVSGCSVSGYVKGSENVAGVCAASHNVYDCVNYATVLCDNGEDGFTEGLCGGVVGELSGKAENCVNYGDVSGREWTTAGVVGGTPESGGAEIRTIENCFNYGTVDGYLETGGVAGFVYNTVIQRCGNHAEVSGMAYIGGVLCASSSYHSDSFIINCYNKGNLIGKEWGDDLDAIMIGRYDYIDEQFVGGIVCTQDNCDVCNCYSWGSAQCLAALFRGTSAGITAYSSSNTENIANSYANLELSNTNDWEPLGIGLDDEECDNCFFVNGGQYPTGFGTDQVPGQPESEFLDGTVLSKLNEWPTQETDSVYVDNMELFGVEPDEWVQGEYGPVFIWE